jgi:hypothetical protein
MLAGWLLTSAWADICGCFLLQWCRVGQVEQRALQDLEAAAQQCRGLEGEVEAVHSEFKRYQAMKAVEVRLLEQRVMQHITGRGNSGGGNSSSSGGKPGGLPAGAGSGAAAVAGAGAVAAQQEQQPVTVGDLEAACRMEGIAAALREASLERLQREHLEQQLAAAQAAGEQLAARAKAAEHELAGSRSRQAAEAKSVQERTEQLTAELADCQQALQLAKSEGSRRLKELQALQRHAAASENGGGGADGVAAAAQLAGEQQGREAAEAALREARQGLARKAALIKDLKAKVSRCLLRTVVAC